MTGSYQSFLQDARRFLGDLAQNNSRDWWQANKGTYDAALKAPALALLEDMAPRIAELADASVTQKLFRPHRDVRFSKDKTPYNTHLHMMWSVEAQSRLNPVFFFGVGLDYVTAGAGIMGLDKAVLADWRKFVDLDTDRITGMMSRLQAQGYGLREPELKRVPPPYDKAHPAGALLRMKSVVASKDLGAGAALPDDLMQAFTDLWPLNALLIQVTES